jgi:peptidoglycan/xylan/chitin deacetylase (PgdA/CDA1 family)
MIQSQLASSRPSTILPDRPVSDELAVRWPSGTRWALCLSHDVDHLSLREHFVDGFLLRYAANLGRQNLLKRFRPGRALDGAWGILEAAFGQDRWEVLEELLDAERRAGVVATWFVPVRPGRGIAFGLAEAGRAARCIAAAGHEVGLHGQADDSAEDLALEASDLAREAGVPIRGLRMHSLRLTQSVLDGMERAGLRYDSTVMERRDLHPDRMPLPGPVLARQSLVEIPLHVMDSTLFSVTGLGQSLDEARRYMRTLFARAARECRVLVVNLHPNFYSRQSPEIRAWYDSLLNEATSRSDVFLTNLQGLVDRMEIHDVGARG